MTDETITPLRSCDPRLKLISAVVLIVGIVTLSPLSWIAVAGVVVFVIVTAFIAEARLGRVLFRSLIVLPIVGLMALLSPLRYVSTWTTTGIAHGYAMGWPHAVSLVVTAWLSVLVMMLFAEVCPPHEMLQALEGLHLPHTFVMLLTFIYRYLDTLRAQVVAMRRALISRAPRLSGTRQVILYGNLAGALLIRAYDRGDRVWAAMMSRGFTGTLPRAQSRRVIASDFVPLATSCAAVVLLALTR